MSDLPARYIESNWYVPVADLTEALDALERLHANALRIFDKKPVRDWAETLGESSHVLRRNNRPASSRVGEGRDG